MLRVCEMDSSDSWLGCRKWRLWTLLWSFGFLKRRGIRRPKQQLISRQGLWSWNNLPQLAAMTQITNLDWCVGGVHLFSLSAFSHSSKHCVLLRLEQVSQYYQRFHFSSRPKNTDLFPLQDSNRSNKKVFVRRVRAVNKVQSPKQLIAKIQLRGMEDTDPSGTDVPEHTPARVMTPKHSNVWSCTTRMCRTPFTLTIFECSFFTWILYKLKHKGDKK
jgi:hypothetical protein